VIDLYYWPTPNGWKVSIALEEMDLPYRMVPVDLGAGAQFEPDFLAKSPNNRMPAIVDSEPLGGGPPLSVFESGAILIYLADKSGRFLPEEPRARYDVLQWLMWQMGGLGPMLGQNGHFRFYSPETIPYAKDRYTREAERLYGVLDRRLADREFIATDYSIADMACWPWVITYKRQEIDLGQYPNVRRWYDACKLRPGRRRGYELGKEFGRPTGQHSERARQILFGAGGTAKG